MFRRGAGVLGGMKKLMIPVAAAALAVTLAACGGSTNNGNKSSAGGTTSAVLKDTSGMALYTPQGESATNIPGAATLKGSTVITRPDGTKQLVVGGKPLYTFAQDSPGQVTGNGAQDAFAGKKFTWHAVQTGGTTAASTSKPMPSGGGGYGSSGY
jgi:predicted lipoprotein with Yx(FWY)xxD motif